MTTELDDREQGITELALHLLAQLRQDKNALDEAFEAGRNGDLSADVPDAQQLWEALLRIIGGGV